MRLKHLYTLICDDVRVEVNGKLIIIGLYTPNILIPQLPFVLPSLSFLQFYTYDGRGQFHFRARLQHLESGRDIAQAIGIINHAQPGIGIGVIRFGNLVIDKVGTFNLAFSFEGDSEPINATFEVILHTQQPSQLQPPQLGG